MVFFVSAPGASFLLGTRFTDLPSSPLQIRLRARRSWFAKIGLFTFHCLRIRNRSLPDRPHQFPVERFELHGRGRRCSQRKSDPHHSIDVAPDPGGQRSKIVPVFRGKAVRRTHLFGLTARPKTPVRTRAGRRHLRDSAWPEGAPNAACPQRDSCTGIPLAPENCGNRQ